MGSPEVGAGNSGMVARECTRKRPSASAFDGIRGLLDDDDDGERSAA
jgi:hypothetical protein